MPNLPSSPETIQRAARGDVMAFREVLEWLQPYAYSVAYRFTGDGADAEDLVQEAFVRLWRHLPTYKPEIRLTTWLYRIVVNLCLDFLKSRHGRGRRQRADLTDGHRVADYTTPEKELQHRELWEAVYQASETLPPKQRAVFVLRDLEGLTAQEVSETLEMDAGTVKSNLFHARQRMGEKLRAYYQETSSSIKP